MQWKVGIVPKVVFRDFNISRQDLRTAKIANYLHERAEEQRQQSEPEITERIAEPVRERRVKSPAPLNPQQNEQAALRLSLMRKLTPLLDHWRQCPARACRRHRRCASPALECSNM